MSQKVHAEYRRKCVHVLCTNKELVKKLKDFLWQFEDLKKTLDMSLHKKKVVDLKVQSIKISKEMQMVLEKSGQIPQGAFDLSSSELIHDQDC